MHPVLLSIGNFSVSSFGLFLLLAIFTSSFVIWRIAALYDLEAEKVLDLIFLTIAGGIIGARIYFIILNLPIFDNLLKIILITKYGGLSFWGGLLAGGLTLRLFSQRLKINFWRAADFAIVGLALGIAISSIGCLLGSCQYGLPSKLPFAVIQVGLIGKRFPLQIVESILAFLLFLYLWGKVLRFHIDGQVASIGLILLGVAKFLLEFFRGDRGLGQIWSVLLIFAGVFIYYLVSKKSFLADLKFMLRLATDGSSRQATVLKLTKSWYNFSVSWHVTMIRWRKNLLRLLNIKPNPPKVGEHRNV